MYVKILGDINDIVINNTSDTTNRRILSRIGNQNWADTIAIHTSAIVSGNSDTVLLTEAAIKAILPSSDHGSLTGLGDDDHTIYHTDDRAATWLANNHESTYNHGNYDTTYTWMGVIVTAGLNPTNVGNWNTAYGWGNHSGLYSLIDHNHNGIYEPAFSKATGFNLPLGTTAGTVAEGNHTHSEYITSASVTYETLNANGDVGTSAGQLAIGNHTHSEYSNLWTQSGTDLYYNTGNVGIGTTSPSHKLSVIVDGDGVNVNTFERYVNSSNGSYLDLRKSRGTSSSPTTVQSNDYAGGLVFYGYTNSGFQWGALIRSKYQSVGTNYVNNDISFETKTNGSLSTKLYIQNDGAIGISTTSPYSKLDVNGEFTISNDAALGSGAQMVQNFVAYNSVGTQKEYGNISVVVVDNNTSTEDANMYFNTLKGGTTSTDIAILSGVVRLSNGMRLPDTKYITWELNSTGDTYIKGVKHTTEDWLELNAGTKISHDTTSPTGGHVFNIDGSEILNIGPNGINLGSSSPVAANSIVADGSITAGVDITVGGILKPDTDSGADIGETAKRFKNAYLEALYTEGKLTLDSASDQEIWQKNGNDIKIYSDGSGKVILNTRIQLQLTTMESGELDVGTSWEHVARINITPDMVGLKIKSMYISCGTKPSHTLYVGARRADASGTLMGTYYEVFSTTPAYTSTGNILREFTGVNTSNNTLADKEVLDIRCYYASTPTTKAKDVVVTLILDV